MAENTWWDRLRARRVISGVLVAGTLIAGFGSWSVGIIDNFGKLASYFTRKDSPDEATIRRYQAAFILGDEMARLEAKLNEEDTSKRGQAAERALQARVKAAMRTLDLPVELTAPDLAITAGWTFDYDTSRSFETFLLQKYDRKTAALFYLVYELQSQAHLADLRPETIERSAEGTHNRAERRAEEAGLPPYERPSRDDEQTYGWVQASSQAFLNYVGILRNALFPRDGKGKDPSTHFNEPPTRL